MVAKDKVQQKLLKCIFRKKRYAPNTFRTRTEDKIKDLRNNMYKNCIF